MTELNNQRHIYFVTTFMMALILLIMLACIAANTLKIKQLEETNAELIKIIKENNKIYKENFVTREEYNKFVKELKESTEENEDYKNLLAEHYTKLITDFVTSQNEDNYAELEFVENEDLRNNEPIYYTNDIVESDGYVSEEYFEEVMGYYYKIPEKIRKSLAKDGWKIEITSDELKANDGGTQDQISGVTIKRDKTIYITTLNSKSIIHEVGHYLDIKNNFVSNEMSKAYAKDIAGFYRMNDKTSTHNYASLVEYFAESFKLYVLQQKELKSNCKDTYRFIEQSIDNL